MTRTIAAIAAVGSLSLLGVAALERPATAKTPAARLNCGIAAPPNNNNGKPIFPELRTLNASFFLADVDWRTIAPRRPAKPRDPADPAYAWSSLRQIFSGARAAGIEVVPMITGTPGWANGDQPRHVGPTRPQDYADFLYALSTRYPGVKRWLLWGEPSRAAQWIPQGKEGARAYAVLLDAGYGAIKKADPKDLVIGGNTQVSGYDDARSTSPASWLRWLVLPNGHRPRMDLWGHNPFTERPINLRLRPVSRLAYDFNDLDSLAADLDRYYPRRRIGLFLSETGNLTEHANGDWFFLTTRADQAARIRQMYRIATTYKRIAAIANNLLYDQAGESGWTTGLRTVEGLRKPSWYVYRKLCARR
jgi:hypothetical protein